MEIKQKLFEYKGYIILGGLVIGGLSILDYLPESIFFFEENTKYVFLVIVAVGIYAYWQFHWGRGTPKTPVYQQTVPSRRISNPAYQKELMRQMGVVPPPRSPPPQPPIQGEPPTRTSSSKKIFDKFKND